MKMISILFIKQKIWLNFVSFFTKQSSIWCALYNFFQQIKLRTLFKNMFKATSILLSLACSAVEQRTNYGQHFFHFNHSDLDNQNLFHATIDAPSGVSKNPNDQTEVYSSELER